MIVIHVILTINITTVKLMTRGGRGFEIGQKLILCERSQTEHTILTYFTTFLLFFNIFSTRNLIMHLIKVLCF